MNAHFLGIDPGAEDGAAVLLEPDGRTVAELWAWHRLTRTYRVHIQLPGTLGVSVTEVPSLHAIASRRIGPAVESLPYHLVVEELFVWTGHDCGFDTLAEATGEIYGPLRDGALTFQRVLARKWRAAVLQRGWGRTSAEAERAAWQVCAHGMTGLEGWLQRNGDGHPRWAHVLEAACLARWGWVQQQGPAQMALVAAGRRS